MTDIEIAQMTLTEVKQKTFGTTEQFLEIHSLVYEEDIPKIARIDRDREDGTAIVYFPVKNEKFYLAIYVQTDPVLKIVGVGTEPYHAVYFWATSHTLDFGQLSALTTLTPTGGWNKGDPRK